MACLKAIQKNLRRDCNAPLTKGVDSTIFLFMRNGQQVAATFDTVQTNVVTAIAFGVSGAKLYAYEGNNYSVVPQVGFTQTEFDTTLPQTVTFKIFSNSAATKAEIDALLTRKDLGVITKREGQIGDYEIYGLKTGMRMTGFDYQPNSDDKGAYTVTLTAPDETSLPYTLIHKTLTVVDTADYLLTLVAVDA